MQQQVIKRNAPSDLGWGSEGGGGWGQQTSAPGSGSWTSTANQENSATASTWQPMGKSDSASDPGDDSSSVKSGSTITSMTNMTSQSQENTNTNNSNALQSGSSSLWSNSNQTLSGMDSSPWNSGSPAPSGVSSMGWSFPSNQVHNMQGSNMMNNSSAFNSSGSGSSGWPTNMSNNSMANTSSLPPNMGGGNGNGGSGISSHWPGSSMLGNIGDFSKSEWNSATTPVDNIGKEMGGTNSDQRMWSLPSDKSGDTQWDINKSQWGNPSPGDQSSSNTELSFAQATLKGLKAPSANSANQSTLSLRQEEILRAIENHEGWGSRPIRQDTSWDVETSPKSHRKFSTDSSAGASNVWNNSNGTAIWEAVRENQSGNWTGGSASGNTWNAEKDQPNWTGPPKPPQEPSWNVGNGTDPKAFGTWGAAGAAGDVSNKMWGQKTEVGSWGENSGNQQRTTSISSWGDDGEAVGWEDQTRRVIGGMQGMVPPSPSMSGPATNLPNMMPQNMPGLNTPGIGTSEVTPWNESQKQGWNPSNVNINRTKIDESWNKPPPNRSGWGDPTQDNVKVDDGTSIWTANALKQVPPQQPKPAQWPDGTQGQWNPPIGTIGTKPKAPAGWDEASWALAQRAKSGRFPEDVSANSVEVGYWNGLPQDNSTWNDPAALRGVRKITGQQMPPKYTGSGNNPPNQMRAKLLQELMDMGYRKEEAQNALIVNNLNLKLALNYLKTTNGGLSRKDLEMDVFPNNSSQSRLPYMPQPGIGSDDLTDMRPDQVPPFSNLQNTQFSASQVPNQPFMQSSLASSGLSANSTSINSSLQQKLMQKMQQQAPPTPTLGPRGQIGPVGNTNNQVPQQQQQQQILDQLRQAVNNGFISPQLLNYQLPHNILVLLQQLLQLQSALQNMVAKHQQLLQQARATGNQNNPQVEQMSGIINQIKQQIIALQKQLQQAQNNLFSSQKPPNMSHPPSSLLAPQSGQPPHLGDNLDAITSEIANVVLQSRLTSQWKPSTDSSTDGTAGQTGAGDESGDNKTSGAKGLLQSSSSPNLIPGGLGMTGDKTWSSNLSTTSSNWPLSSSDSIGTSAQSDLTMSTSTSAASILTGMPSRLTDVIPEFIPGKPWQGLTTPNVEDDPHVTPGSIQRSLSVNRVHDDSLNNLDGHKLNASSPWASGFKNDSLGLSQLGNRPPPVMVQNKAGNQQWQSSGFNRQASWPHSSSSAFTKVGPSNWNDNRAGSSWVVLKNIGNSMDSSTLRSLCAQHGTLTNFNYVVQAQLALVQYGSRDSAATAQKRLNNFAMGSSIITAEFINESDAQRYVAQMQHPQPNVLPPMNTSPWSQAPPSAPYQSRDPWGNSMHTGQPLSKYNTGGVEPWNLWDMSDHTSNPILSNILGSESM